MKTADEVPNWSLISNVPTLATIDATAPAAVANLAVTLPTVNSITLTWTAPGDDGTTGTATQYDVRYSTATITPANWDAATQATGEPAPLVAGTAQNFVVSGLQENTRYYFAMKTADEVPNWSGLSNVPTQVTSDATPPSAVANLAATSPTVNSITLTWTAPGDDGTTGTAAQYDIRYSTATITPANWDAATQATGEPTPLVAGTAQNFVVSGLQENTRYYFAMKTADEVPNWSAISNVPTQVTSDATPPAAVANLAATSPTVNSITLTWTAPGDDGTTGTAAQYDIRYSTATITPANWDAATQATGEPAPLVAGTAQNFVVSGLQENTRYYFAMKTADEVPNWSLISNVPTQVTSDATPPAAVANLAAASPTVNSITLTWTAPGDDANTGTAAQYDIRYSTATITPANWDAATQATGEPTPLVAGTAQNFVVSGLQENTRYYFAMKTADEVPNWSAISNVPTQATSDATPPAAVANLAATSPTVNSITLTWTAPGDDGNTGTAAQYDVRYSIATIPPANWETATQATGEPAPHVAGTAETFIVTGLTAGTTYYFALKTGDEVPNWSSISNVPTQTTLPPPDTTAPAAVANLAATSPTVNSITLTWTAPGDDANTGTAAQYDIRYSTAAITPANWDAATQATGEPAPHVAGTAENFVVSGLNANTPYYFAMKTGDEVPNWSDISNAPSATTLPPPDTTPPAAITDLAATLPSVDSVTLTWTAPGDDGATGTATEYDVRYSTSTITELDWASATQATGEPAPQAAGTPETFTVTGLQAETPYYFAVKTRDEVLTNWSGLSNVAQGTTTP
jgi:hypothetical protein